MKASALTLRSLRLGGFLGLCQILNKPGFDLA